MLIITWRLIRKVFLLITIFSCCFKFVTTCKPLEIMVIEDGRVYCIECNECPPGFGMNYDCHNGDVVDGPIMMKCIPCNNTEFSEETNFDKCQICRQCNPGEFEVQACEPKRNRKCDCYRNHLGVCIDLLSTHAPNDTTPSLAPTTTVNSTAANTTSTKSTTSANHTEGNSEIKIISISSSIGFIIIIAIIVAVFVYRRRNRPTARLPDAPHTRDPHPICLYIPSLLYHAQPLEVPLTIHNDEVLDSLLQRLPEGLHDVVFTELPITTLQNITTYLDRSDKQKEIIENIWDRLLKPTVLNVKPNNFEEVFSLIKTKLPEFTLTEFLKLLNDIGIGNVLKDMIESKVLSRDSFEIVVDE